MIKKNLLLLCIIFEIFTITKSPAQTNQIISLLGEKEEINTSCFSNGGSEIVFNHKNRIILTHLIDLSRLEFSENGHYKKILSLDLSSDSSKIVSGGQDSLIILWNSKGEITKKLRLHKGIVTAVRFDPTGNYIYSGSSDSKLVCYNIPADSILFTCDVFKDDILSIDISKNGKLLAAGGAYGYVYIIDSQKGYVIGNVKNPDWVRCVRFNINSSILATCCDDGNIYFWNMINPMENKLVIKHKVSRDWITSLDFFSDNESYSFSTIAGKLGVSVMGKVYQYRMKAPVLVVKNRPGQNNMIEVAAATFGKGISIVDGSSIMK